MKTLVETQGPRSSQPDLSLYFAATSFGRGALMMTYLPSIFIFNNTPANITTGAQQAAFFAV